MNHVRRTGILILVALAALLALAGCGDTMTVEEHFQQGNQYTADREYEKAIVEYKAVLEKEPKNVSAMSNLGVAYYNTGQLDEAIAQYENALEISPQDADIRSNLAAAYVQKAQIGPAQFDPDVLAKAREEYQRATELQPTLAEAHFGLGVVYIQFGQNAKAIEAFESFLEHDKGTDEAATSQARQYLKQLKGQ